MKTEPKEILNDEDIRILIRYLCGIARESVEDSHIMHILNSLWNGGKRDWRLKKDLCLRSGYYDESKCADYSEKINDFSQAINTLFVRVDRINMHLTRGGWEKYVQIAYDGKRYRLLTQKEELEDYIRQKSLFETVEISFKAAKYSEGLPIISSSDSVRFSFSSEVEGYLHIYHIDHKKFVQKMFPTGMHKHYIKAKGRAIKYPENILPSSYKWRNEPVYGKQPLKQEIIDFCINNAIMDIHGGYSLCDHPVPLIL